MTRERPAACVLALCLLAAAVAKLARVDTSVHDLESLGRGLGLGRLGAAPLTWVLAGLVALEVAIAAALLTSRHRRRGLVALLALLVCGIVAVGIASDWGGRRDFGCPCGLALEFPLLGNYFTTMLLRDAALVALAALAWGPNAGASSPARVRPA